MIAQGKNLSRCYSVNNFLPEDYNIIRDSMTNGQKTVYTTPANKVYIMNKLIIWGDYIGGTGITVSAYDSTPTRIIRFYKSFSASNKEIYEVLTFNPFFELYATEYFDIVATLGSLVEIEIIGWERSL